MQSTVNHVQSTIIVKKKIIHRDYGDHSHRRNNPNREASLSLDHVLTHINLKKCAVTAATATSSSTFKEMLSPFITVLTFSLRGGLIHLKVEEE